MKARLCKETGLTEEVPLGFTTEFRLSSPERLPCERGNNL